MTSSDDRVPRALEGIEQYAREMMKIFADISGILVRIHEVLEEANQKEEVKDANSGGSTGQSS